MRSKAENTALKIVMHFSFLGLLSIVAALVNAAPGTMFVVNHCPPVEIRSIGSSIGPATWLENGGVYSEPYHYDPKSGGISIAISLVADGIFNGDAQLDLQYTADTRAGKIWYALNTVNGSPFEGQLVTLSGNGCHSINWPNGKKPLNGGTMSCDISNNLYLRLCDF